MSNIAAAVVARTRVILGELEIIFLTGEGIQVLQKLSLQGFAQAACVD
jgi:hypothetical protein